MDFLTSLKNENWLLYDGPMETRIEYNTSIPLPKDAAIFQLIDTQEGRDALKNFYVNDITAILPYHAPIILNAPTWRASIAHLKTPSPSAVSAINKNCIQFVKDIKKEFISNTIFITAPIGPKLSDYDINNSASIDDAKQYHQLQAEAIVKANVDVISIASMWSLNETIGASLAVSQYDLPYSVGVVINKEGKLLDGHSFKEVIQYCDQSLKNPPTFYVISCTHPQIAFAALALDGPLYKRIQGIKANGSLKPVAELLRIGHPIADDPIDFANEMYQLKKTFGLKIFGGCCGTDTAHLAALARKFSEEQ